MQLPTDIFFKKYRFIVCELGICVLQKPLQCSLIISANGEQNGSDVNSCNTFNKFAIRVAVFAKYDRCVPNTLVNENGKPNRITLTSDFSWRPLCFQKLVLLLFKISFRLP